ncbi:MAG: nucleosidase [Jiangellaceae bacterium]
MTDRYLVVAATAAEAAHVPAHLTVLVTGVGKTPAAVATTRALAELDEPARRGLVVLNIGTVGALRPMRRGLYTPSVIINHDVNAEVLRSLGIDPRDRLEIPDGDGTVLASGDVFVTDPAVRDRLAAEADLVDMEGYGVALASAEYRVRVRLIKHVSDDADERSMDWPKRVDASARALGQWLAEHARG